MKFLFTLGFLIITTAGISQSIFTKKDAQELIDTFFEGFHKGDTSIMRSVIVRDLPTQTVFTDREGNHRIVDSSIEQFLDAIANRPQEQRWEERLLEYEIQIDGNLAHVWTPYEFWLNASFSHCGANAFTLGKTNEGWKILHLIDSRRREDCGY